MKPAVGAALDEIYRSFLRARPHDGGPDPVARDPEKVLALARALDLLPAPERVVRVTGSKGKGTVARLIAAGLQAAPGRRPGWGPVGLFVSPEETTPLDRMRIDGRVIEQDRFVAIHQALKPHLRRLEADLAPTPPSSYLSPFGQFLLIALAWFKESGVTTMVLETGRGARFDEVGGIASAVSVVTSILPEHLDRLGPGEADVADHKLAITENSGATVLGPTAARWHHRLGLGGCVEVVAALEPATACQPRPGWLALDEALARRALGLYGAAPTKPLAAAVPSFGRGRLGDVPVVYEAAVQADSLDAAFLAALAGEGRTSCVVSLPDDKDVAGVTARLERAGLDPAFLALEGERGRLHHVVTEQRHPARLIGRCRFDDGARLRDLLGDHARRVGAGGLYLVGTQTFIRLVRRALGRAGDDAQP